MSHVFFSYMRDDTIIVLRIQEELQKLGVKVWLDRESVAPGDRWKDSVREAIKSGAYFIACFSPAYASRNTTYMNEELTLAIEELRLKAFGRTWFIPVLLAECEVPARSIGGGETLLDFQWVDLYTDFADGMHRLSRALNTDQINDLRERIDEYGNKYVGAEQSIATSGDARHRERRLEEIARKRGHYLDVVHELETKFGIKYDPQNLSKGTLG